MTLKFNGWPHKTIGHLLYVTSSFVHYFKPISEFKLELQSGTARFGSKSTIFPIVNLKFGGWHRKAIGHPFHATSSFVYHFITISQFKPELQSENARFGSKSTIYFVPRDLEIWQMTLKNNRPPLVCYLKLCASFHSHLWIQAVITVRKRPICVKIGDCFVSCDLQIWQTTLKNNRTPLQCYVIPWPLVNSNWSYAKFVLTSATLSFGLRPWYFAWISLLSMVITPENFMMIRWQGHCERGVTGGRTDRRTDRSRSLVAAKKNIPFLIRPLYMLTMSKCLCCC